MDMLSDSPDALCGINILLALNPFMHRWSRRTVQQIQRHGVESCKSSKWHELRLQVCRWYGRLLLETLTVHGWTSCRMSIRLAVSRYTVSLQRRNII